MISVLTRSGTNAFHGEIGGYFSGNALGYPCGDERADFGATYCDGRKTLRENPIDSSVAEYVVYPEDTIRRFDPGLSLGGPIVRDRLRFFAGYQPLLAGAGAHLDLVCRWRDTHQHTKDRQHFLVASLTGQPSALTRFRVAYNGAHGRGEGVLPSLDGNTHPEANLAIETTSPNWSLSGTLDYLPTKNLIVSLRGGLFTSDALNEGVYQNDRYVFRSSNIGMAGVPPELQQPGGTQNQRSIYEITRSLARRSQAQLDTTVFFDGAGRHQLKLGVGFDRRSTGGYGVIRHLQDASCGGRHFYDGLRAPDFETLARSAGMPYWRVRAMAELGDALRVALRAEGPTMVEVDMQAIRPFRPVHQVLSFGEKR